MKQRFFSLFLAFVLLLSFTVEASGNAAEPEKPPDTLSAAAKEEKKEEESASVAQDGKAGPDDAKAEEEKAPPEVTDDDGVDAKTSQDAPKSADDSSEDVSASPVLEVGDDFPAPEKTSGADGVSLLSGEDDFGHILSMRSGELGAGEVNRYTFTPSYTAEYVFESMNASGDAFGWIEDTEGNELAHDDDSGSAGGNIRNFRISCRLTAGTTYYCYARWYNSSASGQMSLQWKRLIGGVYSLADGSDASAYIASGGEIRYFSFRPSSSGPYIFESVNATGDSFCHLYDDSLSLMTTNDDGGNANGNFRNFRIFCNLTAGQTYYYGVCWYDYNSVGDISVRLRRVTDISSITVGSSASASIASGGGMKYFSFRPVSSGAYIFESFNSSGDPCCYLYSASSLMAFNDDNGDASGNLRNFRISCDLTAGRTYYFGVGWYNPSEVGDVSVRLRQVTDITPVSLGDVASTNVGADNQEKYFSFSPDSTGVYFLESVNANGDPMCSLYNGSWRLLSSDDDAGSGNGNGCNFRLPYVLIAGQTYYYGVRWYDSDYSAQVFVRIGRIEEAISISPGDSFTANVGDGETQYFVFRPVSSGPYFLESVNADGDPLCYLYDDSWGFLAMNDDGGNANGNPRNFSLSYVLSAGQTYYFGVSWYGLSKPDGISLQFNGAADVQSIAAGESKSALIGEGGVKYFRFQPSAENEGKYIFESLNDSGDPRCYLYNSSRLLASNDDGGDANGNSRNFRLLYDLSAGQTYYFGVRWYSSSAAGDISVRLRKMEVSSVTLNASASTRAGSGGEMKYFKFCPGSADLYVFESLNDSGDPRCYLYDASLRLLSADDDGGNANGNPRNFRISCVLNADQDYYYGVRWYDSGASGDISVRLKRVNGVTPVSLGTSSANISSGGEMKYLSFRPGRSGAYVFESCNLTGDPICYLYDSSWTRLTYGDDSENDRNFTLRYSLTADETYYYAVGYYNSGETGRIDLRLSAEDSDDALALNAEEASLKAWAAATVNGTSNNATRYCSFTPKESGVYIFESMANEGDPQAALYDAIGGHCLASDDDGGDGSQFRLSYSLTAGASYYYAVKWNGSNASSTMKVRLRRDLSQIAAPLTANSTAQARISSPGQVVYFSFAPSSSRQIVFQSISRDENVDPYVTLYDANFHELESNDDGAGARHFRIVRSLDSGNAYYFAVKDLNDDSTGALRVSLGADFPSISLRNGLWTGSADIDAPGNYAYFAFTPSISGTYVFESVNQSGDPIGYLYADGPCRNELARNDNGGSGNNFSLSHYLTANRTYYYGVRWGGASDTGVIQLRLRVPYAVLNAYSVEQDCFTTACADIPGAGAYVYFAFTPESDGKYTFESMDAQGDVYACLYSGAIGQDLLDSCETGGDFRIERNLTAKTTYYYGVRRNGENQSPVNVRLKKEIPPVNPTAVSVTLAESEIYVGNQTTARERVLPNDASNKTVVWTSSNPAVATVTGNGIVQGVGQGTARISATTHNGVTGSATVTVIPQPPSKPNFFPDFTYNFKNLAESFSSSNNAKIPLGRYMQLGFSRAIASELLADWGGYCFGMSLSSVLFYKGYLQEENYDSNVHVPHDFHSPNSTSISDTKLRSIIELLQASQFMPHGLEGGGVLQESEFSPETGKKFNPAEIFEELQRDNPVALRLRGKKTGDNSGSVVSHEVVIYKAERSGELYTFSIYDCSGMVTSLSCSASRNYSFAYDNHEYDWMPQSYCPYELMEQKCNAIRGYDYYDSSKLFSLPDDYLYIFFRTGSAITIENASGQSIKISRESQLISQGIRDVVFRLANHLNENPRGLIILPKDAYRITGPDSVTVANIVGDTLRNPGLAVQVDSLREASVTISANLHDVTVQAQNRQPYNVTYKVYNNCFDTIALSGVAGGTLTASLKDEDDGNEHIDVSGVKSLKAQTMTGEKPAEAKKQSDKATSFSVAWSRSASGDVALSVDFASAPLNSPATPIVSANASSTAKTSSSASNDVEKIDLGVSAGVGAKSGGAAVKGDDQIAGREQTSAPTFVLHQNPASGQMELEILCDDDAIVYYYAVQRSDSSLRPPASTDNVYSTPILVTPSTRIVAVAKRYGDANSDSAVASWTYEGGTAVPALAYGRSLSLEGNIGVNFYVRFPENLKRDPGAYVTLNEQKTLLADAPVRTVDGTEYGFFTYTVPAKEMNRIITLKVYDGADSLYPLVTNSGEDVTQGFDYSVQTYLVNAQNKAEKLRNLCRAMSDYGSCAQRYFGYDVASAADIVQDLNAVTGDELQSYARKLTTAENAGVAYAGTSVILESETSIRHVFTLREGKIGDYVFAVNGKPTQPVFKDNYYSVYIGNIAAKNLAQSFTVTVSKDGQIILSVEYSVLTYAYSVLTYDESKLQGMGDVEALKNLARSLCLYNRAARAYFER